MAEQPPRFAELGCVSPETLAVLSSQQFERTTPVQHAVIPLFCSNKDVAVDAETGSGKTLAFLIPIVEKLRSLDAAPKRNEVLVLVVAPTRELALQIHMVAQPFFATLPHLRLASLIGGTSVPQDLAQLQQGAHCIVGTPGRVHDVLTRSDGLSLKSFEFLVLDEADRLLEMGFSRQLDGIMARLPRQRRTGLFSATQTAAVTALVRAGMRNPYHVNVAVTTSGGAPARKTPTSLDVRYMVVPCDHKVAQLLAYLQHNSTSKVICYALTCATVEWLAATLPRLPGGGAMPVLPLHGNMKQSKRQEVLAQFTQLPAACLLATDVAARGLDLPDVHCVLQLDPPQSPATFVHRCGRTARAGRAGAALCLLLPHEDSYTELLASRHVPMAEQEPFKLGGAGAPASAAEVCAAARALAEADRAVMERATRAFVAHVRGYKEHHCRFIFQLSDLDMSELGRMLGVLRLPVMKEVRKNVKGLRDFQQSSVDPDSVPYLDPIREKGRQKELRKGKLSGDDNAKHGDHKGKKCKDVKKQQRLEKAAAIAAAAKEAAAAKKVPAAKRQMLQAREDRDDLEDDYRAYKKHKKGKMRDEEYMRSIGLLD